MFRRPIIQYTRSLIVEIQLRGLAVIKYRQTYMHFAYWARKIRSLNPTDRVGLSTQLVGGPHALRVEPDAIGASLNLCL